MYHVLLHPSTVSDADGRYPGIGRARCTGCATDERQLSAISGWDFYRTQVQLLAWLRPDVASQVVRSLRRDAQQLGHLPRWPLVALRDRRDERRLRRADRGDGVRVRRP